MKVGPFDIQPGTKQQLNLEVAETITGPLSIPVTAVCGSQPGPKLCIMAACHPGELNGVVASILLAQRLDPCELSGSVVIVHAQNVVGVQFEQGHISPLDSVNMGHAYPLASGGVAGDQGAVSHQGVSVTHHAANAIFSECIVGSCGIIDLHGGEYFETLPTNIEILPIGEKEMDEKTREFAKMFDVDLIWEVPKGSIPEMPDYPGRGSAVWEAAQLGIPGAFFEVGGEGRVETDLVEMTIEKILNVMRHFGILQGEAATTNPRVLVGGHVLFAERAGFLLNRVSSGQEVSAGDVLGELIDLSGAVVETVTAPSDSVLTNIRTLGSANPGDMLYVLANTN